jgi:hypothetical protein
MHSEKLKKEDLLNRLAAASADGGLPLPGGLEKREVQHFPGLADAFVRLGWPGEESFQFSVEAKLENTPVMVAIAWQRAKLHGRMLEGNAYPMVLVPYLSEERLDELEREGVSGIDACGNGLVIVPGRIYARRSGRPNLYPSSRSLNDPFKGRSAMVGRVLLQRGRWPSLGELHRAVEAGGMKISLSQVSKAVSALADERIVRKVDGEFILIDGRLLLDRLALAWRSVRNPRPYACNLPPGVPLAEILARTAHGSSSRGKVVEWAITGESSVSRYAAFSQGGPRKIAVSNLLAVADALGATKEVTPAFADVHFIETEEPGYYFANEKDGEGTRWASRLQTWLELQAGDARQRDVARDMESQIISEIGNHE